jgi:hypothetical protein
MDRTAFIENVLNNLIAQLQNNGLFPTDSEKVYEELAYLGEVSVEEAKEYWNE